ncbi:MAG: hypothetical protein HPY89_03920 [Pelotomaculum sp.]|nr:hypothetical protein [Pelotomaculum sp.]
MKTEQRVDGKERRSGAMVRLRREGRLRQVATGIRRRTLVEAKARSEQYIPG